MWFGTDLIKFGGKMMISGAVAADTAAMVAATAAKLVVSKI